MKIFLLTLSLGLLALAVGCGNQSPQDVANQLTGQSVQTRNQITLSGDWKSACSTASVFGNFKSEQESYHFGNDGTFEKKFFFYNDNNCQNPSFVRLEDGSVKFNGSNTPDQGASADFTFNKVSIVPDNQNAVSDLNALKYCGVNTYVVGQPSDVTAQSSNTLCVGITRAPRTTYELLKLNDSTHLVLGDDAQQADSSKRPTTVNNNLVFVKQ
jgi:hypothetical protein